MDIRKLWQCFTEIMTGFAIALLLIHLGILGGPEKSDITQLVTEGNEVVITPPVKGGK